MRKALFLSGLMLCVIFLPAATALDGDGDGVDDSIDICPFAAGTANSTAGLGCPDSNSDGLADFEQTVQQNWGQSFKENIVRVWLHTCSLDHKNALKNYLSRGMVIFKSEFLKTKIA